MTETRLCACGCQAVMTLRKGEKPYKFETRQYVNLSHYFRTVRQHKTKTCPQCRKRFLRKRGKNGRLESTHRFEQRITCSQECYAEYRRGKKRRVKVGTKPPSAPQKRPRAAARPKQLKVPKPTPVKPQTASQRVFTGLPDPTRGKWQTIAPASVSDPCPYHPSEHAGRCTACKITSTPRVTPRRPYDTTPVHRRS